MAISPGRNLMLYLNCDILKFEPLDAKHKISFSALCERWQDSDVCTPPRMNRCSTFGSAPFVTLLPGSCHVLWHVLQYMLICGCCVKESLNTKSFLKLRVVVTASLYPCWSIDSCMSLICWMKNWPDTHTHRAMRRWTVWKHVQTCATANCNVCTCHLCDFL